MQPKSEGSQARPGVGQSVSGQQICLQYPLALFLGQANQLCQLRGQALRAGDGPGSPTHQHAFFLAKPQFLLNPARQGILHEGLKALRWRSRRLHPLAQACDHGGVCEVIGLGNALQGLADDVFRLYRKAKDARGHIGDSALALLPPAAAGHGGRGADTEQMMGLEALPQPAHQQGHVGPLAPAVGVEFVEHQEFESPGRMDQVLVTGPGKDEVKHDVVGQQDVRGPGEDLRPLGLAFLPRVARKPHRAFAVGVALVDELIELVHLTVGQGVHGVDHDGLDALAVAPLEHVVDDGNEVGQALAGARPRSDHVVFSACCGADGLLLVTVQLEQGWSGRSFRRKMRRVSGCSSPSSTRRSRAAPGAKVGFSCTSGSGQRAPSCSRACTYAAIRSSRMRTKLVINLR